MSICLNENMFFFVRLKLFLTTIKFKIFSQWTMEIFDNGSGSFFYLVSEYDVVGFLHAEI